MWRVVNNDELYHHGRKGQQWGVTNGPPYPLGQTNKEYKKNQVANVWAKTKQFMYDRFSEYGKDHQAVRDKYIEQYKKKGYNETASQILAEQKYQESDRKFWSAAAAGIAIAGLGPLAVMGATKAITAAGGIEAVKKRIGQGLVSAMTKAMSSTQMKDITSTVAKTVAESRLVR